MANAEISTEPEKCEPDTIDPAFKKLRPIVCVPRETFLCEIPYKVAGQLVFPD
jgi:hypothetical protein